MTAEGSARHPLAATSLRQRTAEAVQDPQLQGNVARAVDRFAAHRTAALAELDGADHLRDAARQSRDQVLANLPDLLEQFADAVLERGGHVCWASTAVEARSYVAGVVRRHGARRVAKSKSMATEEISLDVALEAAGAEVIETDLGEWIVQLAEETPSHIIAPALHRDRHQVRDLFVREAGAGSDLGSEPDELMQFAREHLREVFLEADVGITGANLGVVESGSIVLVTNEGNGRLVTALPRVHVVVLGMERLVASWDQADLLLALLARSATGQRLSSYTSVVTGTRRAYELDGPDELHVVVLDNGRSRMLGDEYQEMLACMEACPVDIPLQDMLLSLRRDKADRAGGAERAAWRIWAAAWSDARRYGATTRAATWGRLATSLAGKLPVATRWADGRTLPEPARERFRDRWRKGLV